MKTSTDKEIIEDINRYCAEHGITAYRIAANISLSVMTVSRILKGETKARRRNVLEIKNYIDSLRGVVKPESNSVPVCSNHIQNEIRLLRRQHAEGNAFRALPLPLQKIKKIQRAADLLEWYFNAGYVSSEQFVNAVTAVFPELGGTSQKVTDLYCYHDLLVCDWYLSDQVEEALIKLKPGA